jgi:hypothetical protein
LTPHVQTRPLSALDPLHLGSLCCRVVVEGCGGGEDPLSPLKLQLQVALQFAQVGCKGGGT